MANSNSNSSSSISPVEAIKKLNVAINLNDMGLPSGIYRSDLLPYHLYDEANETFASQQASSDPQEQQLALLEGPDGILEYIPVELGIGIGVAPGDKSRPVPLGGVNTNTNPQFIAGFPADKLSNAFVPLDYGDGYPQFSNGNPFWAMLEHEPPKAYDYFQAYLAMPLSGDRADLENDIAAPISLDMSDNNVRTILGLSKKLALENPGFDPQELQSRLLDYYHTYYWAFRAKSYDLFKVAQNRKTNELRAISLQDEHYVMFRRMRLQLMKYFESEEDFWDMMTPKVAIDLLKLVAGGERMSVGLAAGGPGAKNSEEPVGRSMEMLFRQTATANNHLATVAITESGSAAEESAEFMKAMLEDPNALTTMQELIIRFQSK